MLDLGFLPDVERILKMTPETRQTMLFSATMPAAIVALARTHMRHPMNIRAESSYENAMVPATAQFIYQAHDLDKPEIIGRVLQAEDADKMHRVHPHQAPGAADRRRPGRARLQRQRRCTATWPRSRARRRSPSSARTSSDVLVATDVAARGIDVARRHPRRQLHLPRGRQDLRPPDRPHRPRRRHRHRDHVRRLGRPAPLEDDQQGARPARSTSRRRPTPPPSTSSTTRASRRAPRAASSTRAPVERKPRDRDRGDREPRGGRRPRRATATAAASGRDAQPEPARGARRAVRPRQPKATGEGPGDRPAAQPQPQPPSALARLGTAGRRRRATDGSALRR